MWMSLLDHQKTTAPGCVTGSPKLNAATVHELNSVLQPSDPMDVSYVAEDNWVAVSDLVKLNATTQEITHPQNGTRRSIEAQGQLHSNPEPCRWGSREFVQSAGP